MGRRLVASSSVVRHTKFQSSSYPNSEYSEYKPNKKNFLPTDAKLSLYYALVYPHLSYGIHVWGNANKTSLNKTFLLQKRGIRIVHNAQYRSHTDPLFQSSKVLKLNDIYTLHVALFMHDYKAQKLPISFNNTYKSDSNLHPDRLTRQSDLLYIGRARTKFSEHLPLYTFPKIWNKITTQHKNIHSRVLLKKRIKNHAILEYK